MIRQVGKLFVVEPSGGLMPTEPTLDESTIVLEDSLRPVDGFEICILGTPDQVGGIDVYLNVRGEGPDDLVAVPLNATIPYEAIPGNIVVSVTDLCFRQYPEVFWSEVLTHLCKKVEVKFLFDDEETVEFVVEVAGNIMSGRATLADLNALLVRTQRDPVTV